MPSWIQTGYEEYSKRLPKEWNFKLLEIPLSKHHKNNELELSLQEEGEKILATIPRNNRVIVLDEKGESWSTLTLANHLKQWQLQRMDICLLIGGPAGLDPSCKTKAEYQWSLSALTLPHSLVRVIVVEQLYRAASILKGHPYHRE